MARVAAAVHDEPPTHVSALQRFPALDWHEAYADQPDEVDWLVEPLLEVGRLVAVFSPPKAGKSLLALELAAALATGRPVLGNPARRPRHVLYVDAENGPRDVVERLKAYGYAAGDLHRLHFLSFPSFAALDSIAGGRHIVETVEAYAADVVVLDTVSRFVAGDENDAATFANLYRIALAPLKHRRVTVLRLDHSGKDAERGQRGSSAKGADVDDVWLLVRRDEHHIDLRRQLSRHGHGADTVLLERREGPLRHVPTGAGAHHDGRVDELLAELDDAQLPPDTGRERAKQVLTDRGIKVGNELLAEALRRRKALVRVVPGAPETPSDLSGTGQPAA